MILADTGFFIALGNKQDRFHKSAVQAVTNLNELLITTYPVVTETSYLLARDAGLVVQFNFLEEVANGSFSIFGFQSHHITRMVELMRLLS